ncbi:MAG TPA: aldo/keto reductase [Tepidisphaeraceae bacterium]|nr:aldo/keto reductase [Tepidisphaeraceae bacterium]
MEYRPLGNTGLRVSALSYGASPLGSLFREVREADGIRAVHVSLDRGINFIDVSPYYGLTKAEAVLGKALREVSRDRYILATKVGRYSDDAFDFSAARVTASVDESMQRLGVEHIDLIQVHDMEFGTLDQVVEETLPALRKLQQAGKVRFVGITGLPLKSFRYVTDRAEVDTILSYCHYSLNDTALAELVPDMRAKGVGVINASPLSMGILSNRPPPAWHPAPAHVKEICARAAAFCKSRGADIEKLAVQFSVINPEIATTIVGSANPDNMEKNVRWIGEPIDQQLLADVMKILEPIHNVTWTSGRAENN